MFSDLHGVAASVVVVVIVSNNKSFFMFMFMGFGGWSEFGADSTKSGAAGLGEAARVLWLVEKG